MQVSSFIAITLGFVVYFIGVFLTRRISLLREFNIPEPVSGGLFAAVITGLVYLLFDTQITFDLSARDALLVVFFTTIGLNAQFADLIRGGKLVLILLGLTLAFMIIQSVVGLVGAQLFGLPRPVGVLLGTASLIGGHGTAIAWGPTIQEQTGFEAAAEIGIAAATLGLVVASIVGGPIAKFLIQRDKLTSDQTDAEPVVGIPSTTEDNATDKLDHVTLMRCMLTVHIAIIFGYVAHEAITAAGLKLPLFVPCLLVGIVMSNTLPTLLPSLRPIWPSRTKAMAVLSDYALSVFLSMSLMALQLWTLAGLGVPLLGILILQVVAAVVFIIFLVYRLLGRNYTAAVLSAGYAGFSLGATPTAIANMSAVAKRFGPAPLAFILLPLVSAFFVDLANAVLIQLFTSI
ncbi:MAG: sodium/glutamate symporter [Planctomycetota bacterium]